MAQTLRMRVLTIAGAAILLFSPRPAQGQAAGSFTKAVVGDHIRKVEDGVDEFRKYLEHRGEDAKGRAETAQSSGTGPGAGRPVRPIRKRARIRPSEPRMSWTMLWAI